MNNNIDDYFKSKLQNHEADFNPSAWEGAEKLIESNSSSGWLGTKGIIASIGVLLVGVSAFLVLNNNVENSTATSENKQEEGAFILVTNEVVNTSKMDAHNPELEYTSNTGNESSKVGSAEGLNATAIRVDEKLASNGLTNSINNNPNNTVNNGNGIYDSESEYQEENENDLATEANQPTNFFGKRNNQKSTSNPVALNEDFTITKSLSEDETLIASLTTIPALFIGQLPNIVEIQSPNNISQPTKDRFNLLRKVNADLILGFDMAQGYLNPSDQSRRPISLNPVIGLKAGAQITNQVSFNMNVIYHYRKGLSSEVLPEEYNVGSNQITGNTLHYVNIPLYIDYETKRNIVSFGMQYSYLLRSVVNDGQTNVKNTNKYYAPTDMSAVIGYRYMLTEYLDLGFRYNYGLFDVTHQQSNDLEVFDRNTQLRLFVQYSLSKY